MDEDKNSSAVNTSKIIKTVITKLSQKSGVDVPATREIEIKFTWETSIPRKCSNASKAKSQKNCNQDTAWLNML